MQPHSGLLPNAHDHTGADLLHHYVIVRGDLPRGLQAAQIIHAAGESAVLTNHVPTGTHAVALEADDEAALDAARRALDAANIPHVCVVENDAPYTGQLMAIGVAALRRTPKLKRILGRFKLIK